MHGLHAGKEQKMRRLAVIAVYSLAVDGEKKRCM
jgi:transcription termination factor NusB